MFGSSIISLTLLCFLQWFKISSSSRLVHEQAESYRKILTEGFHRSAVDIDGLLQLLQLMNGNPKYNRVAIEYLTEKLGSTSSITFDRFEEILEKIYGDLISDDPYQPQEIHLALGNELSTMKVQWVTMENLEKPFVQYQPRNRDEKTGSSSSCENSVMDDTTTRYSNAINYTYTVPQKWWPIFTGVIYEANMIDLLPHQSYCYRVGGYDPVNATIRYSNIFPFTAAPRTNHPSQTTKIATLADHGTFMLFGFETIDRMVSLMEELAWDMVFVAGDLSYAGLSSEIKLLNISKEDEFEHIWDLLGIQNERISARVPWMVGVGNHERFYNWTAVSQRYKMPQNTALGSNGNFWYSFAYGNVEWISLSSEHSLDEGSDQRNFFINALEAAQANRVNVPWIVVSLHKPFYCSVDGSPSFASLLEPLLLQYDVDLTITGHMHAYERIHPVENGQVTVFPTHFRDGQEPLLQSAKGVIRKSGRPDVYYSKGKGPVHVMQGHAGGMQAERWISPTPAWSAYRMADGIVMPSLNVSAPYGDLFYDLSDNSKQTYDMLDDLPLFPKAVDIDWDNFNYSHSFGFGLITAFNASHLHFQSIPNVDGLMNHDEFWIVKEH